MKFHFLTIFPEMITAYMNEAILSKAVQSKKIYFDIKNIREYTLNKHKKVDDRPYGGGPGMVMSAEPILRAFDKLKMRGQKVKVIMLSPSGKIFDNKMAKDLSKKYTDIVFVCGRYEGVDDRVRKILRADEVSVGNFVLTGGELPALTMTDAISRHIDGVLGKEESKEEERNASPRVYTRPETLEWPQKNKKIKSKKYKVPKVLLSGNHKEIEEWRIKQKNKK